MNTSLHLAAALKGSFVGNRGKEAQSDAVEESWIP